MSEQQAFTPAEIQAMTSATAFDRAGARIGSVGDVYLDDATGRPDPTLDWTEPERREDALVPPPARTTHWD